MGEARIVRQPLWDCDHGRNRRTNKQSTRICGLDVVACFDAFADLGSDVPVRRKSAPDFTMLWFWPYTKWVSAIYPFSHLLSLLIDADIAAGYTGLDSSITTCKERSR